MKWLQLATSWFLAITAISDAGATVFDFTYTGSLVTFTVPATDTYRILAFGAQGGSGTFCAANCFTGAGGRGAEIGGIFTLTAGDTLQIAVGGMGESFVGSPSGGGGGGGGTFVVGPGNMPLIIAGGGGGGAGFVGGPLSGQGGLTGLDGGGVNGGTNGNGGGAADGGGGGGFFSAGAGNLFPAGGGGGGAFPGLAGGTGSRDGGFGGGGGAGIAFHNGSGGGGGYSGGGGGAGGNLGVGTGGGGGSFDAGADQILFADFQTGNGEVVITELAAAVPEPTSFVLLGVGLVGVAALWRRRRVA